MLSPAARFRFGSKTDIVEPRVAPQPMTPPPIEVERFVFDNGLISVAKQKFSVGRRLAGQYVIVRIDGKLMHVFCNGELIKSEPRRSEKEVTRFRANRPYRKSSKSV
jgi:hypothetical protein